jgi:hypothetical protein
MEQIVRSLPKPNTAVTFHSFARSGDDPPSAVSMQHIPTSVRHGYIGARRILRSGSTEAVRCSAGKSGHVTIILISRALGRNSSPLSIMGEYFQQASRSGHLNRMNHLQLITGRYLLTGIVSEHSLKPREAQERFNYRLQSLPKPCSFEISFTADLLVQ